MRRGFILAVLGLFGGPLACSADAVEEPLPTLQTSGAFVARSRETGGYRLFRTRTVLTVDATRTFLFFDEHLPGVETLTEARTKARDPKLALAFIGAMQLSQFEQRPYDVVWYRSMTPEERSSNGGL